jgi:hypothetical protein
MAHLLFLIEGIKKDLDEAVKWLETRIYNLPAKTHDGKDVNIPITANLRPIQLYDYIVPKEAMPAVIKALNPKTELSLVDGKGTPILKKSINLLRKLLKLKPIPKVDDSVKPIMIPENMFRNLRVLGVGYKDDIDMTFDNGLTHEAI